MSRKITTFLLLLGACFALTVQAQDRIARLAGNGGVLLHSPGGEVIVGFNQDRSLVPASIIKIPLAQVALQSLGEDFRFETQFFRNDRGDVLVRGLGDPFLVSEELERIASSLASRGLEEFRRLVVDDSAFEPNPDLPLELGADDPYAARNSALAVNFNTVNLDWDTAGNLISGEEQTPLTPVARELGARLTPGAAQRINLGSDPEAGLKQAQQLLIHFMRDAGIVVMNSSFHHEPLSEQWRPFYTHRSSVSLRDNLEGMLRYSNNFIANQLFLTLAAQQYGYPATTQAAREALYAELARLYGNGFGGDPDLLLMLEGSGLAREQRVTAVGMIRILEFFKPYANLLTEANGVLRKSGTLTGVYNYAGYIPGDDGLYPFVILTNQGSNNRDEILALLRAQVE